MSVAHHEPGTDAARLRQRGLRVTGPRLAILAMLEEVGGHRSADELVLALRRAGYHHARTTVYNALDDLARAKLVRAAPVDAGALRYESNGEDHHHFVCRNCGLIRNVAVAEDLSSRPLPTINGAEADELDVVYRGLCGHCAAQATESAAGRQVTGASASGTVSHATHDGGGPFTDTDAVGTQARPAGGGTAGPSSISGPSTTSMGASPMVDLRSH